jgi:hypothetical protein
MAARDDPGRGTREEGMAWIRGHDSAVERVAHEQDDEVEKAAHKHDDES